MAINKKLGLVFVAALAALALSACGATSISGKPRGNFSFANNVLTMWKDSAFCFNEDARMTSPMGVITVTKGYELMAVEPFSFNIKSGDAVAPNVLAQKCVDDVVSPTATASPKLSATVVPSATVAPKPAATAVLSPTATVAAPAAGPVADRPPFRNALPITGTSKTLVLDCKGNDRGAMVAAESGTITLYGTSMTTTYAFGAPGNAGQRIENAAFVGCIDNLGVNTLVVKIGTPGQGTINVLDNAPTGGAERAKTDFYSMLSASNKNNCIPAPSAGCNSVNVWGFDSKPTTFDLINDQSRWEAAEFVAPKLWK